MDIKDLVYPLSRYWYNGGFRFYYAYGNTPPQDFLQNCQDVKQPSVLVLGCGDIRSCFYSMWKNFDSSGHIRFEGVHFVLNDYSPAVHARNILLLYLCLTMPKDHEGIKKWLSSVWAIWFCHELYPQHNKLLHDSLYALCMYSKDWTGKSNLLHPMVKFSSDATFNEVCRMWKMWLEHDVDAPSVRAMHLARQTEFQVRSWSSQFNEGASGFVEDSTEIPFEDCQDAGKLCAGKAEVLAYLKSGSNYAEKVLGFELPQKKTIVNLTLFEKEDWKYTLHYRSLPFSCFFHSVEFSAEQFQSLDPSNLSKLFVKNKYFKFLPFLANSVQQLSLWLQSSHKVLTSKYAKKISFTVNCSHALTFCYELEKGINVNCCKQFDLVYTSNLMDHLGPPNLVLSAIPLLKENGLLFTATLYKRAFKTIESCLGSTFGFDSKLFPVVLGVRCINYEGRGYASPVTVHSCPMSMKKTDYVYHEDIMIWEKLSGRFPLVFPPHLQLPENIANVLFSSVLTSVYTVLKQPLVPQMMTNLCVETAIKIIQFFMLNVCANFTPHFWQPLSDLLKPAIKPYLHSMQTQLLLHGIHIHLSVDRTECPFCLDAPISNHIGLFTERLYLQEKYGTPKYIALVHEEVQDNAEYLCTVAREGGNVFVFDCISPTFNPSKFLELYFYAPLKFVKGNYKVTIASVIMSSVKNFSSNLPSVSTKALGKLQIPFTNFLFFKAPFSTMHCYGLKSFGSVSLHVSNGDSSEVEINVHSSMSANDGIKLQTQRLSSSMLQLSYGEEKCVLDYLFPISYSSIKIKLSKKDKKLFISSPRALQPFEEEKSLFVVNPDKEFSLVPFTLSMKAIESLSGQEFTASERKTMESCNRSDTPLPPLIQTKKSLMYFFQKNDCFYNMVHPTKGVVCLVIVNSRLFDYESRTPVIDLAFCFLEESFVDIVAPLWIELIQQQHQDVCNIDLDDSTLQQMKEVFFYFASRTNGTCTDLSDTTCNLNLLNEIGIQTYFVRGVIFLLLCDPDCYFQMIQDKITTNEKSMMCDKCGNYFQSTKLCSGCKKAMYCSKKCQREHWKVHKQSCRSKKESSVLKPFPLARYWYDGDFRFYYAFGNTPAEDFLENYIGVDVPEVLLLGCGDIRSCFYTLWKNFDPITCRGPRKLQGVNFLLNDCSSPVLARNIVFLHLCLNLPPDTNDMKEWICAIWAIWYCHELLPKHQKTLNNSLEMLIEHSESHDKWKSESNPLNHLIKFTSSHVLTEISVVWKNWYEKKVDVSVDQMHHSRQMLLKKHGVLDALELHAYSVSKFHTFIIGDNSADDNQSKVRASEVSDYMRHGNCYAERVLNLNVANSSFVNPTLYERSDNVYSLHYGSCPYNGYYHTAQFSPEALSSMGVEERICKHLLVTNHYFKKLPFLANSIQQFSLWLQSASKVLHKEQTKISFTFNNDHAVSFCQKLEQNSSGIEYDLIYSSNLIDHLGPPNVVLPALPLLKPDGLLFTTTLIYKTFANSVNKYLEICFGFDCKYLPVILGIRCINVEGSQYACSVIVEPTPVEFGHMLQTGQQGRRLIWQKVLSPPNVISQLAESDVLKALLNSVQTSAFNLLDSCGNSRAVLNNICTETAINVLKTFLSHVLQENDDFRFWGPLSSSLCSELSPFIHGLQTQLLLHNLHLHLTVTTETCPICTKTSIEEHVGSFRANISLPIVYTTPHFLVLIHQLQSSDVQYLCGESKHGKNVHIIDCIDGHVGAKTLELNFFAPLEFVSQNYNVTIALSQRTESQNTIITALPTTSLRSMQINFVKNYFPNMQQTLKSHLEENDRFGKLNFHICKGDETRSEIILSDSAVSILKHNKLDTRNASSNEIILTCGKLKFSLIYKYPVSYNHVRITWSKTLNKVTVISPRKAHEFVEEMPVFIKSPDNQLSLLPQEINEDVIVCHTSLQKTREEKTFSDSCNRDHALMTPLMNLKESITILFQCKDTNYFQVNFPKDRNYGIILVNKHLFDYQHKAPALDLAFYFPDVANITSEVVQAWKIITKKTRTILVDDAEYDLLRKTLFYFSKRTNGNLHTAYVPNQYQILHKKKVQQYFTRATIFPLYCDPDLKGNHLLSQATAHGNITPPTGERCSYCSNCVY